MLAPGIGELRVDGALLGSHTADGRPKRFRRSKVPTREQAEALEAKAKAASFGGRFFEMAHRPRLTVAEAWALYEPVTRRDNDS